MSGGPDSFGDLPILNRDGLWAAVHPPGLRLARALTFARGDEMPLDDSDPYWARRFQMSSEQLEDLRRRWADAGREAWTRATRAGGDVVARTQRELEALGRAELERQTLEREQAHSDPAFQAGGALHAFVRGRNDSRAAKVVGADKYFHCKANCEATRLDPGGAAVAPLLSDLRERFDPKNYQQRLALDAWRMSKDEVADRRANRTGREAAQTHSGSCSAACDPLRPLALPKRY